MAFPLQAMPHTDDFGSAVKSLLIPPEQANGIPFIQTSRNLEDIAKKLGIQLFRTERFFYVRDHFFRLSDGSAATAATSNKLEEASERTHSANLYLHRSAATHTKNQLFNSWSGRTKFSGAAEKLPSDLDQAQYLPHSYIEGGNMFTLSNTAGQRKVCLGIDCFWQTLLILELENRSWDNLKANLTDGLKESWQLCIEKNLKGLSPELLAENAEEMFALGLLLQNGKSGLIHPKVQLPLLMFKYLSPLPIPKGGEGQRWYRKLAVDASTIPNFNASPSELEHVKPIVAAFMAKKKLVRALIAQDLKIAGSDLHLIPQANYHLDNFLTPGPQGSIFITDYALACKLLSALKLSSLSLNKEDLELLDRYIETAQKLDVELGPLLHSASFALQEAGFLVLPAPNSFIYEPADLRTEFPLTKLPLSINFANAVTGWSHLTNNYYYITHGMQSGFLLGSLIMDAFAAFISRYIPNIDVYYVGKDEQSNFSEAMEWWNQLETQSGIHCISWPV